MPTLSPRAFCAGVIALTLSLSACDTGPTTHLEPNGAAPSASLAAGGGKTYNGETAPLGAGQITAYADINESGRPYAIGIRFGRSALDNLPHEASDGERCFDMNADSAIDLHMECAGGHETLLELPDELRERANTPFKFVMVNYNPHGHQPPGVYDTPHFDVHFYTQSDEDRRNIRLGACAEVIDCELLGVATEPLAPEFAPPGHTDVGAAMGMMGNHLIDLSSPEFNGSSFTHTWIWGVYDGRVTYFEPMIAVSYLKTEPRGCFTYQMPQRLPEADYYPTRYCIEYNVGRKEYTVSLDRFRYYGGN